MPILYVGIPLMLAVWGVGLSLLVRTRRCPKSRQRWRRMGAVLWLNRPHLRPRRAVAELRSRRLDSRARSLRNLCCQRCRRHRLGGSFELNPHSTTGKTWTAIAFWLAVLALILNGVWLYRKLCPDFIPKLLDARFVNAVWLHKKCPPGSAPKYAPVAWSVLFAVLFVSAADALPGSESWDLVGLPRCRYLALSRNHGLCHKPGADRADLQAASHSRKDGLGPKRQSKCPQKRQAT